ncbi:hypothetical protein LXL04_001378 [Taraxacum kok-saghyz]
MKKESGRVSELGYQERRRERERERESMYYIEDEEECKCKCKLEITEFNEITTTNSPTCTRPIIGDAQTGDIVLVKSSKLTELQQTSPTCTQVGPLPDFDVLLATMEQYEKTPCTREDFPYNVQHEILLRNWFLSVRSDLEMLINVPIHTNRTSEHILTSTMIPWTLKRNKLYIEQSEET